MASDVSGSEGTGEGNLLVEAVTLLVQRQRETESWLAEQICQTEERFATTDRRYAELEARLEGIESHLARLVHEVEPARGDAAVDDGLARLRAQVEGLKSGSVVDARPAGMVPTSGERSAPAAPAMADGGQGVTFWDLLGHSPQDRFGLVLIGAGAVAVAYALLTQLRFS